MGKQIGLIYFEFVGENRALQDMAQLGTILVPSTHFDNERGCCRCSSTFIGVGEHGRIEVSVPYIEFHTSSAHHKLFTIMHTGG